MTARPHLVIDPAVRFGEPSCRGISADAVAGMVWAGESVEATADDYGLTRPEVLVACWHQGIHGTPKWRKRWGTWAEQAHPILWNPAAHEAGYDAIPDPPDREEAKDRAEATARTEALRASTGNAKQTYAGLAPHERAELSARIRKAAGYA